MSTPLSRSVDPLTFEIVSSAMQALVEEVGVALARSAYSTNIKTRQDFASAIFDKDARVVVQAATQASHLGSLTFSVPLVLKEYATKNLNPGDGILINDAFKGMVHLNDISLISPLWYQDKIFGYVVNIAHHVDVGGRAPGSIAVSTEIYQEGIIIPGVKILRGGEVDDDILRLIVANVRGKKQSVGDFRAQIAANKLAERRVRELLDRFGVETVNIVIGRLFEYTEKRVRAALKEIPQGEYYGEGFADDNGITDKPIRVAARVKLDDTGLTIDLSDSDDQNGSFTNSTYAMTYSGCVFTVKCLLPTDIPVNDGFYRVMKVVAPLGKVVNCEYPHAVAAGWEIALKTTEAVLRAWSQALPGKIPAEGKKTLFHIAFGGRDPRNNGEYAFLETIAGGYGARPSKDGEEAVQAHYQNTENSPIEELEIGYPVLIGCWELISDSGGGGIYRGGLGVRRSYTFVDHAPTVSVMADTAKIAPEGSEGGMQGRLSKFFYYPDGAGSGTALPSKTTFVSKPNGVLVIETPGGGGYGNPIERDVEAVLMDVRNEKVSLAMAQSVYGVEVDPAGWKIDHEKTEILRRDMKSKGGRTG